MVGIKEKNCFVKKLDNIVLDNIMLSVTRKDNHDTIINVLDFMI